MEEKHSGQQLCDFWKKNNLHFETGGWTRSICKIGTKS